jgi:8-oxo-dGTP diphosphatase
VAAVEVGFGPKTFALVRHAHAGNRAGWKDDDERRPLSAKGRREADGLVALLAPLKPSRILSSPYDRCVQTVEPLAAELGLKVEVTDALAEEAEDEAIELVRRLAGKGIVACSHGDIVPAVLAELVVTDGLDLGGQLGWPKASTWLLGVSGKRFNRAHYLRPPRTR